jgi:hypothetical protein
MGGMFHPFARELVNFLLAIGSRLNHATHATHATPTKNLISPKAHVRAAAAAKGMRGLGLMPAPPSPD